MEKSKLLLVKTRFLVFKECFMLNINFFVTFYNIFVQVLPVKTVHFINLFWWNLDVSVVFSQFVLRKMLTNQNKASFTDLIVLWARPSSHFHVCHHTENTSLPFKNQEVCNISLTQRFMLNNWGLFGFTWAYLKWHQSSTAMGSWSNN